MRQVSLLIGRQSYSMKTALSDNDLKDAQDLVNEIMRDTGIASEQEIRLALTCMVLANRLAVASRRLDRIASQSRGDEKGGGAPEEDAGDNKTLVYDQAPQKDADDNETLIYDRVPEEDADDNERNDVAPEEETDNSETIRV